MAGKSGSTMGAMFGARKVDTFLGLPKADPDKLPEGTGAAIFGVTGVTPYASVGPYCAGGPAAIRAAIADDIALRDHPDLDHGAPMLGTDGFSCVDRGDLPYHTSDFATNRRRVTETTNAILDAGAVPLVIGGDDSVPSPVLQAYEGRGDLTILQIDAHIDWRDEVQGEKWGLSSTMRRASEMNHVRAIVQAGQRAHGSARVSDLEDARTWGVTFVPMRAIAGDGIAPVLEAIPEGANVFISLDVDAFDPSVCPAVIGRAPGGLAYWDVFGMIRGVADKATIAGFAMVELMPDRDVDQLGAHVAARTLCNVINTVAGQR